MFQNMCMVWFSKYKYDCSGVPALFIGGKHTISDLCAFEVPRLKNMVALLFYTLLSV